MAITYQGGNDVVVGGAFAPMMKTLQQNIQYERQQQEVQRKEQEAISKSLQSEMSKLNANGLRQRDKDEFFQAYGDVKNTFHQYRMAKDASTRGDLAMQLNEKIMRAQMVINQSKEIGKLENEFSKGIVSGVGKIRVNEAKAFLDSTFARKASEINTGDFDISKYLYTYDPNKVVSAISGVADTKLGSLTGEYERKNTIIGSGGKRYDVYSVTKQVPDTDILQEISKLARGGNRDVQNYVQEIMTSDNVDFNTAVAIVAEEYKPKFTTVKDERLTADKPKGQTINVNVNSNAQLAEQAIEYGAPISYLKDSKGDIIMDRQGNPRTFNAQSSMALNKTQSLNGIISGVDPSTSKQVSMENPKNAEIFGIIENAKGTKLLQIRYTDSNGEEQIMLSPNTKKINYAELTKGEKSYLNLYNSETDKPKQPSKRTPSKGVTGNSR